MCSRVIASPADKAEPLLGLENVDGLERLGGCEGCMGDVEVVGEGERRRKH